MRTRLSEAIKQKPVQAHNFLRVSDGSGYPAAGGPKRGREEYKRTARPCLLDCECDYTRLLDMEPETWNL